MSTSELRRRGFLARLASGTLALTGLAAASKTADAAAIDLGGSRGTGDFDDGWTAKVKAAMHKAVFDSPEVNDGLALFQAWIFRAGYKAALDDELADVLPVVVLRHAGTVLAFDDALWAKYRIGQERKVTDPVTKQPAVRNPWARTRAGEPSDSPVAALLGPGIDPTVEGLVKSGAVVLACDLALRNFARGLAARSGGSADAVAADLRAGLIPGVIMQPSGVYASIRAQEVGAAFMRST